MCTCSVVPNSLRPPTRLVCPWNFSGKNIGVGCHFLLQGMFPTQGSNLHLLHLLHWQAGSPPLAPPRKPSINYTISLCVHIPSLLHKRLYFKKIYSLLGLLIYSHFPLLYSQAAFLCVCFWLLQAAGGIFVPRPSAVKSTKS